MSEINFPKAPKKSPTKKQMRLFNRWVAYLSDSKLSQDEIYNRAAKYAEQGLKP